jgi:uncharacterized DUF497 family protein
VRITYDPAKRITNRRKHGLDFEYAGRVFAGLALTALDEREDYGEDRYQTIGLLDDQVVMVVWTPSGQDRRVISMRRCNARERDFFHEEVAPRTA